MDDNKWGYCITICVVVFIIFVAVSVKGCQANNRAIMLKCLQLGHNPVYCERLLSR